MTLKLLPFHRPVLHFRVNFAWGSRVQEQLLQSGAVCNQSVEVNGQLLYRAADCPVPGLLHGNHMPCICRARSFQDTPFTSATDVLVL